MADIVDALRAERSQMEEWFEHMHRHPELSMQEAATAQYIARLVGQWGYEVETGIGRHGIVASLTVGDSGRAIGLRADFAAKRLAGTATLTVEAAPGAREVVLDTRDLAILGVTDAAGQALEYTLGEAVPHLGRPLTVALPEEGDRLVVRYQTSPDAAALQWLTPQMTTGGEHAFLFTQGQAILTRTWVPTQDSPGIRQTYEARIVVPEPLVAVMSAEMLTPEGEPADDGRAYRFALEQPVPPYLMALAVGDLAFREVGPRTGVYAEPAVVEKAAWEFADMERMLEAAEALYGPYRWGRYDVLVLPPSFPFGGMENPRLTFATPTILAGDRSLVSLIAHELAHSWSGNLVTNATWDDFWLNEGFTSYFENRIMEAISGPDYAAMLRSLSRQDLEAELADLGAGSPDTLLHLDLEGRDPDEGMTAVAYDKGAAFLRTVELAAGRERFDAFLRAYFDRHAFRPMTTERFVEELRAELIRGDAALEAAILPDAWIYGPGLPGNAPEETAAAFVEVEAQAGRFSAGTPAAGLAVEGWSTHEWLHFLRTLPAGLSEAQLRALDETFALSAAGNSEIRFAWLRIAVRERYEPAFASLEAFLTGQGRRKFLQPLYQDLAQTDWGRAMARRIYEQARPTYHPVSTGTIDAVLGWEEAQR